MFVDRGRRKNDPAVTEPGGPVHSPIIAMTCNASLRLLGLFLLASGVACDEPKSNSLGNESAGDPSDAVVEIEPLGTLDGGGIFHLAERPDGSIAAAGVADYSGEQGDAVFFDTLWVGIFASEGGLQWEQRIPVPIDENRELDEHELTDLDVGPQGEVYVSIVDYSDTIESENRVIKFSAAGQFEWALNLGARPRAVAALPTGGALIVGSAPFEGDHDDYRAWTGHVDDDGTLLSSRDWDPGSGPYDAMAFGSGPILLAGSQAIPSAPSESEVWFAWTDSDQMPSSELVLPDSEGRATVRNLRRATDDLILASAVIDDQHTIVALDTEGNIVSTTSISEDELLFSAHSPTGFLSGDRTNCIGPDPAYPTECSDAVFAGVEAGVRQWEATIEGCGGSSGLALGPDEAVVVVGCNNGSELYGGLMAELRRIRVE